MPIARMKKSVAFFKAVDFGGSNRKVMEISTVIKPENYLGFYEFLL
jgi:hypothetical protein